MGSQQSKQGPRPLSDATHPGFATAVDEFGRSQALILAISAVTPGATVTAADDQTQTPAAKRPRKSGPAQGVVLAESDRIDQVVQDRWTRRQNGTCDKWDWAPLRPRTAADEGFVSLDVIAMALPAPSGAVKNGLEDSVTAGAWPADLLGLLLVAYAALCHTAVSAALSGAHAGISANAIDSAKSLLGGAFRDGSRAFTVPRLFVDASGVLTPKPAAPDLLVYFLLRLRGIIADDHVASGAQGAVLRCTGPGGESLAVKVMLYADKASAKSLLDQELQTYRLLQEHRTAGTVSQAALGRVVPVLGACRYSDGWHSVGMVVMPMARTSLIDAMEQGPPAAVQMTPPKTQPTKYGAEQLLGFLADVCLGLEALHAVGMSACDLKDGNVLIFPDDDFGERAVLTDMAMNAALAQPGAGGGGCLGTAGWNSFRQPRNEAVRPSTLEADWFVFAKLVLVLLADAPESDTVLCGITGAADADWPQPLGSGVPLWTSNAAGDCIPMLKRITAPVRFFDTHADVARLAGWAADLITAANRAVETSFAQRAPGTPVRTALQTTGLFPAGAGSSPSAPGFVPPGLESARAARAGHEADTQRVT